MIKSFVISFATFSLFQCIAQELTPDPNCGNDPGSRRSLRLSVNSKKNHSGEWMDTFTARTEFSNSSDSMGMDLTHEVIECEGKRVIYIRGVSKAAPVKMPDRFSFHSRHGANVEIINNGRSAQRVNYYDRGNAVVFTSRPLKDDELFEIRLDKMGTKYGMSLGFGLITSTPADVEILPDFSSSPDAWMLYHSHIYSNNTIKLQKYKKNIDELQVGDRVGVMRKSYGGLHFFMNGVDQGPAVYNISFPVYGVVEICNDAQKVTIVEA